MINYIIGAGGHSRAVIKLLLRSFPADQLQILNLENENNEQNIMGVKFSKHKDLHLIREKKETSIYCAIGDNNKRISILNYARKLGFKTPSLISNKALLDKTSSVGNGSFVGDMAYIGPLASVGDDCIVNTCSIVEHETIIKDGTQISPNATICGRCLIKENCFIGAGATVIDKVIIEKFSIIGAGATVVNNITLKNCTWLGTPARKYEKNK